jgi:hypothetical protein
MRVPTTQWSTGAGYGTFLAWDTTNKDAEDMCDEWIAAIKPFWHPATIFDGWTIWTMATPTSPPHPMAGKRVTVAGTSALAGAYAKATQATWTFYTTLFGIFKVVMLDVDTAGFEKITSTTASADELAFIGEVEDATKGWSGRDGAKPLTFKQIAFTLNEKLRREYHEN